MNKRGQRQSAKWSGASALLEHLLQGNRVTNLEAIMLFGVASPARTITSIKRKGFIVKTSPVNMATVVRRLNSYDYQHQDDVAYDDTVTIRVPAALPVREIQLTEYWISR